MSSTEPEARFEKSRPEPVRNHFNRFFRSVVLGTGVIYLAVILFLVLSETQLVYPGAHGTSNWNPDFTFQEVWVDSTDGARIHGWYLPKEDATRFVLLHHGNGENVAQVSERYALLVSQTLDANVLVYDYRGFGKSEGTPYEQGVIDDAEAMLKWLLDKSKLQSASEGIIYYGSSLGGGVAIGLAERQPPAYLVLDRTFDSITSAGAKRYPWVPVRLLMRNRFNSAERIQSIDVPLFQSHFTNDELCGIEDARKLFDAAKTQEKEFFEMPRGGHYDPLPKEYWIKLREHFSFDQVANASASDPGKESKVEPAEERADESEH